MRIKNSTAAGEYQVHYLDLQITVYSTNHHHLSDNKNDKVIRVYFPRFKGPSANNESEVKFETSSAV